MRKNNNNILYIILTFLGASTIVFLCLFLSFQNSSKSYKNTLENNYKKSYYEVVSNVNDLEVDLSKIVATKDNSALRMLLTGLNSNVLLTIDNINQLPIEYNNLTKTNNYLNKINGYSYILLEKLYNGETLSDDDYAQINDIHSTVLSIKYDLNNYYSNLDLNFSILSENSSGYNEFSGGIINTESANSKVPSLIYDGPFSDSVLNKEIVGLSGNDISQDDAYKILKNLFGTDSIKYLGFAQGKFETYNFYINISNGLNVSITKKGGFLLSITSFVNSGENKISGDDAVKIAENFAKKVGLNNMYCVWTQVSGNTAYVNLAQIENSVIYYSDLIKVKVDMTSGNIVGWEATNYATNHKSRTFTSKISMLTAQDKLSKILTIKERNYCIIPDKYIGEVSAYEFICSWKNYTYYIYIDSNTGAEANIMRVIDTTNGELLE